MEAEQLRVAAQVFADLPDVRKNRGLNHTPVNLIVIVRMLAHSGPPRLFRSLRAPGPIPLAFLTTDANTGLWIPSCCPVR